MLLLNYYSRSLPTETQKFFGNKFSESVQHFENISLQKIPAIRRSVWKMSYGDVSSFMT